MAFPPARLSAHASAYSHWLSSARARPTQGSLADRTRARRNLPPLCVIRQMRLRGVSFVRVPSAQILREPFQQRSRAAASALVNATALRVLASAPLHLRVRRTNSAADPCG